MDTGERVDQDRALLRAQYARWSTEDLLRVVIAPQDCRPAAVQAARDILATQDPEEVAALAGTVVPEIRHEQDNQRHFAEEPLARPAKALCFVFCGIPGIVYAADQESKGRSRRSRDAWNWVGYGWLARLLLAFMALLFSGLWSNRGLTRTGADAADSRLK